MGAAAGRGPGDDRPGEGARPAGDRSGGGWKWSAPGAARARDTAAFRSLGAEWEQLALSRSYRERLRRWGAEEAALRLGDGNEVVAAGRSRHQARACEVLEALARLAQAGDELAMRTAVQIFLPRLAALVDTYWRRGLDPEERAAMVAAIAGEEVARCVPGEARTPFDFRLWSNIRRRFGRQVAAHGRAVDRLVLAEEAELERSAGDRHQPDVDERDLVALCWWVAELASVDHATARLIVLTRAAGVEIADLATAENLTPATLRKRRSRAEAKLRSALARHHDQREVERCA